MCAFPKVDFVLGTFIPKSDSKQCFRFRIGFMEMRRLCVGQALGKFPKVDFALGKLWANSQGALLRWASFGQLPKGHFCVGERFRVFEKVTFASLRFAHTTLLSAAYALCAYGALLCCVTACVQIDAEQFGGLML